VKVATGLKNPYEVEKNLTGKIIMINLSLQIFEDNYLLMENCSGSLGLEI
jgi:hypothetical protein